MANLVVVSPLPQTSAPCFLLKPLPPDNLCFFVFTTYSLTKSKWNKPLPLIVQGFSLSCSLCFSFLDRFCCLLPSSLSLSHLWPEEKHFHLPPSYHFFLNLSFKVCPRCPSVPCPLLGTLPWRDAGGPTSFQFVPTKTSSGNARLSKEQVQSCVPGGEGQSLWHCFSMSSFWCVLSLQHWAWMSIFWAWSPLRYRGISGILPPTKPSFAPWDLRQILFGNIKSDFCWHKCLRIWIDCTLGHFLIRKKPQLDI